MKKNGRDAYRSRDLGDFMDSENFNGRERETVNSDGVTQNWTFAEGLVMVNALRSSSHVPDFPPQHSPAPHTPVSSHMEVDLPPPPPHKILSKDLDSTLILQFCEAYKGDPMFSADRIPKGYQQRDDGIWLRMYRGEWKLAVPNSAELKTYILQQLHNPIAAGHPGPERMFHLVTRWFHWPGVRNAVKHFCRHCASCQMMKSRPQKPAGALQSMPVPDGPFSCVSMDLITGLPGTEQGNNTIIVWVCRLTKYVTMAATQETTSSPAFAQLTIDHLISKHGYPRSFVSDRDVRFTADFWKSLLVLIGADARMSTAFHPQTDGQTERTNKTLEETLRHFVCHKQTDWDKYLQMAAFAINNSYQESIRTTPYKLVHGRDPRLPTPLTELTDLLKKGRSSQRALEFNASMLDALDEAKGAMQAAQARQKAYADRGRRDSEYALGDMVLLSTKYLKLKADEGTKARAKLLPKFIGPYEIIQKVGTLAYKLGLPDTTRIHPVFHVSLLRDYHDPALVQGASPIPQPLDWLEGIPQYEVKKILDHKDFTLSRKILRSYKVEWVGFIDAETWEPEQSLREQIPDIIDLYNAEKNIEPLWVAPPPGTRRRYVGKNSRPARVNRPPAKPRKKAPVRAPVVAKQTIRQQVAAKQTKRATVVARQKPTSVVNKRPAAALQPAVITPRTLNTSDRRSSRLNGKRVNVSYVAPVLHVVELFRL